MQVFLVDYSWIVYKSFYAHSSLSVKFEDGVVPTGTIFGVHREVQNIRNRFPDSRIIFCTDSRDNFRKQLSGDYKANRTHEHDVFKLDAEIKSTVSIYPSVHFAGADGYEADDVMYSICQNYGGGRGDLFVHSGDNDLLPLVETGVNIFREFNDDTNGSIPVAIIDDVYIREKFAVSPKGITLYKCLRGDSSDNIKGILRFPSKLITKLDSLTSDALDVFTVDRKQFDEKENAWLDKIKEDEKGFRLRHDIIKLRHISKENIKFETFEKDPSILEKYQLSSVVSYMKENNIQNA